MSGTIFSKTLLPGHANDFELVTRIARDVQRIVSGIVGEGVDSDGVASEVKIQMQPTPDGGLAIFGWHAKEPVEGIPEITYDPEIEVVPINEGIPNMPIPPVNPFQP